MVIYQRNGSEPTFLISYVGGHRPKKNMIRVCMVCGKTFGEKPPYEDRSKTHGICEECYPKEIKRIKKEMKRLRRKKY